jgi:HD domain
VGLERAALDWIASYWNAEHLVRTRDWVLELDPEASLELRLAALTHDIERNFPGGPAPDPANPDYAREHAERSARIVREWLARQDVPEELATEVARLVAAHEVGGWPEADVLQAADSLSFLEVNAERPAAWVRDGRCSPAEARARLREMSDRIAVERARAPADTLLEDAERRLEQALAALDER